MRKLITHILDGREKNITKEDKVLQSLPHKDFRFANPLVVVHHIPPTTIFPNSTMRLHPHPHRGFAPVTFQLQGEGYHKDSAGHESVVRAGDVQWMFAGKGLLHSEGPSPKILAEGGTVELIQIWVNVPAKNKFDPPTYQIAGKEDQPKVINEEGIELRLVSGEYEEKKGPIRTLTPIIILIGELKKGKRIQITAKENYWTLIYIASGAANINMESIHQHQLVVFEKENDEIIVCAEEDTKLLLFSAEPIDEPVAAKDNYIMNSSAEIDQAMEDYKNGLFGTLKG